MKKQHSHLRTKDLMDIFLDDELLKSTRFQTLIRYLNLGMTFLSISLISTLTFAWGAMHFDLFSSGIAISLLFVWLLGWFLLLAWQTPLKDVILRSAVEIKTLFRW